MTRLGTLLLAALLALIPAIAGAEESEILLTADGTMYSVTHENVIVNGRDVQRLLLSEQRNGRIQTWVVPATVDGGIHSNPALAYDYESRSVFLFWQYMPNPMSSELLLCSFQEGMFSEAVSIESAAFRLRFNLRIATSRYIDQPDDLGYTTRMKSLVVHAVWWEQTGNGELARYALIPIENGEAQLVDVRDLSWFSSAYRNPLPASMPDGFNRELFRHPSISTLPTQNGVDVIFADWDTNRFQRVEILPVVGDGVMKPPIGIWRGEIDAPGIEFDMVSSSESRISVLRGPAPSTDLIFYFWDDHQLNYLLYENAEWSQMNSVSVGKGVTRDAAVNALKRLVASE